MFILYYIVLNHNQRNIRRSRFKYLEGIDLISFNFLFENNLLKILFFVQIKKKLS